MQLIKQHVVLSLIRSGRYELEPTTGNVISNIGLEKRVIKPNALYTGYLQYSLDIGFNETIQVYGQAFSYLATWLKTYDPAFVIYHIDQNKANNKPDNLRCITQKENLKDNGGHNWNKTIKRVRLPEDIRALIRNDHAQGISFVKIAEKHGTTRQTIAKICNQKC